MPEITATLVKQLRDATNVSMMECKRALTETDGDMAKATRLLRERGMAVAAKRANKETKQGAVASAASADGETVSLVEVNCETDFVARNENFQSFVREVAEQALETDTDVGAVLKDRLAEQIAAIGENIALRRNTRFVLQGTGRVASYIHLGGKVGVLVEIGCGKSETVAAPAFSELVKDMTLHVAASAPRYLSENEVDASVLQSERSIFASQVKDKPAEIVEKIVDGKMKKFFAEICLLDQGFVKEPKQSISALLEEVGKPLDDTLEVRRFVRYQLGE